MNDDAVDETVGRVTLGTGARNIAKHLWAQCIKIEKNAFLPLHFAMPKCNPRELDNIFGPARLNICPGFFFFFVTGRFGGVACTRSRGLLYLAHLFLFYFFLIYFFFEFNFCDKSSYFKLLWPQVF